MKGKQDRQKRAGVIRILLLVLTGIVIGFTLYKTTAASTANLMPMPFGIGSAVVQSGSMEPTYKKGDLLFVKKTDEYSIGDIVVYQSRSMLVVHRIIAVDGDVITTQGDANNTADEPFDKSAIKGKVTVCIPFVGLVIERIKTPIGIIILIAFAVLLIEVSYRRSKDNTKDDEEIKAIKAEIKKLKEEKENKKNNADKPRRTR